MSTTHILTTTPDALVIRTARDEDAGALARLAVVDTQRTLDGPVLVAETDGRIMAALSLSEDRAIADPFHRTADLVSMLQVRAALMRRAPQHNARASGLVHRARHAIAA